MATDLIHKDGAVQWKTIVASIYQELSETSRAYLAGGAQTVCICIFIKFLSTIKFAR
jgi:hypothetical protein